jgi:hypothetical protein
MKRVLITMLVSLCLTGLALAQPQISGPQSGTLGPGTYLVVGNIQVPAGDSLFILPGTTFLHNGYWTWNIYGTLRAFGEGPDSIKWLRQNPVPEHRWGGLRFRSLTTASNLSYCVVEYGFTPTTAPSTDMGGCIFSEGSPLTVMHSRISFGKAWWGGGGICGHNVNALNISYNLICDNADDLWKGGGILLDGCTNVTISHNVIARNYSTGT